MTKRLTRDELYDEAVAATDKQEERWARYCALPADASAAQRLEALREFDAAQGDAMPRSNNGALSERTRWSVARCDG